MNYSYLNATSGSTFEARLAGKNVAVAATSVMIAEVVTSVTGSVGWTPKSRFPIAHDADDLRVILLAKEAEALADRALSLPEAAGHRLVDNRDGWRSRRVLRPERATLRHGDAERREIVGVDDVVLDERAGCGRGLLTFGKDASPVTSVPSPSGSIRASRNEVAVKLRPRLSTGNAFDNWSPSDARFARACWRNVSGFSRATTD